MTIAAMIAAASGGISGFGDDPGMALSDDPWIANHSIIDPERLHALGMITLWWNHCERNLWVLFCLVFGLTPRVGRIIAHDMKDVTMSERIRTAIKMQAQDPHVVASIFNFLDVYDVCRNNRNALTHFTIQLSKDEVDDLSKAVFIRTKGPSLDGTILPSSLEDIRRVALEIQFFHIHSSKLWQALVARKQGGSAELPPLLAPPESLVKPPPQNSPKSKRSRNASRPEPPKSHQ